jgi:hypothetical protein
METTHTRSAVPDVNRLPTALAYKFWLFLGSTPYLFGWFKLPPSLASGPQVFGAAAVLVLWLGVVISIVGLLWPWLVRIRLPHRPPSERATRSATKLNSVVIEAVGLVGVGSGLGLYAVALATAVLTGAPSAEGVPSEPGDIWLAFTLCAGFATSAVFQIREHIRYRREHLLPPPQGVHSGH